MPKLLRFINAMDIIRKKEKQTPLNAYKKNTDAKLDALYIKGMPKEKLKPAGKIFKAVSLFFILIFLSISIYFGYRIASIGSKISIENPNSTIIGNAGAILKSLVSENPKELKGEKEGRINILLLGTAGKGKPGQNLTDTVMVMSINTDNKKIALFSIPRDMYANISGTDYSTKINTIYQYGLTYNKGTEPIKKTVEEITGDNIHYIVILNFDGFKKIIDDVGGVNVNVEFDIYDERYPGDNYTYETFELKKGLQLLDGETALKYVRERHADPEGDFGRAKRQQKVMQAAKNKVFSLGTYLNPVKLNNILNSLGDNIRTDIGIEEMASFAELASKCDTQNIQTAVVDAWKKESILKVSHVVSGGSRAFVLVPKTGNYSEIQDLFNNIFNQDMLKRRKAEIERENAKILIINRSGTTGIENLIKKIIGEKYELPNLKTSYSKEKTTIPETLIYDFTEGKKIYTLDELVKLTRARLIPPSEGSNNVFQDDIIISDNWDIIIVSGKDLSSLSLFEEADIEDFKKMEDSQEYFDLIKY